MELCQDRVGGPRVGMPSTKVKQIDYTKLSNLTFLFPRLAGNVGGRG